MNIKQEDLLPCLLTQEEIDNFAKQNPPDQYTQDDFEWFMDGEVATRMKMPYMQELTDKINARKNLASIKYYKQQLEMRKTLLTMFESDSLDKIKYLIIEGEKLLKEKLNNNH